MSAIGDSSAVLNPRRVMSQHQAAITVVQFLLADPAIQEFSWLDLACGKGQIISQLEENLPDVDLRSKIIYLGYDIDPRYTAQTMTIAGTLNLRDAKVMTSELSHFPTLIDRTRKFDFISFTNTVHELSPQTISQLLLEAILRLSSEGTLYIYDMETLPEPELGAVPWAGSDMSGLLRTLFGALGISNINVPLQVWSHSTVKGWSITIRRNFIGLTDELLIQNGDRAIKEASEYIRTLIETKFETCKAALESLTRNGAQTPEEEKNRSRQLYEFWSLSRAKEAAR